MVANEMRPYLDLTIEDFHDYQFADDHMQNSLQSNNLQRCEIEKRINRTLDVFESNVQLLESSNRIINWDSFNRLIINLVRRSSVAEQDRWKKDKFKRHRRRKKILHFISDYTGKKATDISTHLKMEIIDFLIYGNSNEMGYVLGCDKFISEYKAFCFMGKILWALGLEKSSSINTEDDLELHDNLVEITDRLRVNYLNYNRGSIAGFSTSAKISSTRRSQP